MRWTGIPAVPGSVDPAMAQFLQALKNNLETTKTEIETGGSGGTTIVNNTTIGGGSSGGNAPPSLADFGTIVGDNATPTDAAFLAAEASAFDEIYIPSGIYYCATLPQAAFTKGYWGPGLIRLSDNTRMPGTFTYLATPPSPPGAIGTTGWFSGDSRYSRGEWHVIGPNTRTSLTNLYYNQLFQARSAWLNINDGGSGATATMTVGASAGASAITVNGADVSLIGKTLGFGPTGNPQHNGPFLESHTISNVVGTTISLATPLAAAYAAGTVVSISYRTNTSQDYIFLRNFAEGDAIASVMRAEQRYVRKPGQKHVFETSTAGLFGGDINFVGGSHGAMATPIEFHIIDQNHDVGAIGIRESYHRDNDTGAMAAMWIGHLMSSEGAKPADAGIVMNGKWRVGLDLTGADLSTFVTTGDALHAAINTKLGQRWIMNSTVGAVGRTADPNGAWGTLFGNTPGDMFVESGNDGTSDYIAMRFNRAAPNDGRLRVRPTSVQINKTLQVAGDINGGANLAVGAAGLIAFQAGSGNYITWTGSQFQFYKSFVLAFSI